MCFSILPVCMSVQHVQAWCLKRPERWHWVPHNWSNRCLWVAMCVLGTHTQSSWRAVVLLVAELSSPKVRLLNQTQSHPVSICAAPLSAPLWPCLLYRNPRFPQQGLLFWLESSASDTSNQCLRNVQRTPLTGDGPLSTLLPQCTANAQNPCWTHWPNKLTCHIKSWHRSGPPVHHTGPFWQQAETGNYPLLTRIVRYSLHLLFPCTRKKNTKE